jgi:hypothetical protein
MQISVFIADEPGAFITFLRLGPTHVNVVHEPFNFERLFAVGAGFWPQFADFFMFSEGVLLG